MLCLLRCCVCMSNTRMFNAPRKYNLYFFFFHIYILSMLITNNKATSINLVYVMHLFFFFPSFVGLHEVIFAVGWPTKAKSLIKVLIIMLQNLNGCRKTFDKNWSRGDVVDQFEAFVCVPLFISTFENKIQSVRWPYFLSAMSDICINQQLLCRFCTSMMNDGY